jgi:hypothetical protein
MSLLLLFRELFGDWSPSPPPTGLQVNSGQQSILSNIDTYLHQAFLGGVTAPSFPSLLAPLLGYNLLASPQQSLARSVWDSTDAGFLVAMNISAPFPNGLSQTTVLPELTSLGSNGSMTFVNGFLTAVTPAS